MSHSRNRNEPFKLKSFQLNHEDGEIVFTMIQMTYSPQNYYLSDHLLESLEFLVSGVMISVVSSVGLIGNTLLLILLSKQVRRSQAKEDPSNYNLQAVQKTFHNLLFLLSVYDLVISLYFLI